MMDPTPLLQKVTKARQGAFHNARKLEITRDGDRRARFAIFTHDDGDGIALLVVAHPRREGVAKLECV